MNIKSLPSKFHQLKELVLENIDISTVAETKLDLGFPTYQFLVDSFAETFRLDRSRNGGGIMMFV